MREYFTHKLKTAQSDESAQLHALQENFAMELDVKVQAAIAEMREMLDMREVELFYRHQSESALKEEIVKLKNDYQTLLNNNSGDLLTKLKNAGVNFVVYHPGVGQLTIEQSELTQYLSNPAIFVAQRAGVGELLYSNWLTHYQNPICIGTNASGHVCGNPLVRIGSPVEYHEGESDRCEHHQAISYKRVADSR